jgi:protein involved in polysaccharide export with SLBB domain
VRTIVLTLVAVVAFASISAGVGAQAGDAPAQHYVISGRITNPGRYVWEEGLTVDKTIARAGGLTGRASTHAITIRRIVNGEIKMVTVKLEASVLPDDVITIPASAF